jgi:hypothetical protein
VSVCSKKIAGTGKSRFVCWNITQISLWLLCNVHYVQSTQRTRLQTKNIGAWYKQFAETGCLCKQKSSGRPLTAEDNVGRVRASFLHSPKKSTGTAAKELSMSKTTVRRVLHKRLVSKPYRIQMVQQLSDADQSAGLMPVYSYKTYRVWMIISWKSCSSVTKRYYTSAVH